MAKLCPIGVDLGYFIALVHIFNKKPPKIGFWWIFQVFPRGKPTVEKLFQNVTSENFSVLVYDLPTGPRSHLKLTFMRHTS